MSGVTCWAASLQAASGLQWLSMMIPLSADVAGVAEDGQFGDAAAQFDGDVPLRQVAVYLLVVGTEAPVYGGQPSQPGVVDALQCADPQFEVGVHGVLHQDGDVHAPQRVGYLLHGKGVGRCPRPYPEEVDSVLQGFVHVLGRRHFGGHVHAGLAFHFLEPCQSFHADAFEASGFGAGFPDARPEYLDAFGCQLAGGFHHLFFCFCAARACNDEGSFRFDAGQQD